MNFDIDCEKLLGLESDGISMLEPSQKKYLKVYNFVKLCEIIDIIGNSSSIQRGFKTTITTAKIFFEDQNYQHDRIYIKAKINCVIGYLRIGPRYLVISDKNGNKLEKSINCVVDFYVHPSKQRRGEGKKIFDKMLKFMNLQPQLLAYDGPNSKFINFMSKHYSLINYIKQTNNFVVYDNYFRNENQYKAQASSLSPGDIGISLRSPNKLNNLPESVLDVSVKSSLKNAGDQMINNKSFNYLNKSPKSPDLNAGDTNNKSNNKTNNILKDISKLVHTNENPLHLDNSIKLLNSNPDKRFFNYYFNNEIEVNMNPRLKFNNVSLEDREEFKKKFDDGLYLK